MLFDFEAEHDPFVTAQGSLLLSYYNDNSERHLNTFWLSTAIQSARLVGAYQYENDKNLTQYDTQMKKRLWWTCILRDRILSLGLRRPLQISQSQFDFGSSCLSEDDMKEDVGKSEVYDAKTQLLLFRILIAQCKLAIEITYTTTMLYPSDISRSVMSAWTEDFDRTSIEADRCKLRLTDWYESVNPWASQFPKDAHASVILYTSLIYIYYQYVIRFCPPFL